MKAVVYNRQGPAEEVLRIEEVETPEPAPGEVLVRVRTSGINPSDTKSRAGVGGRAMHFARVIPHSDGAGDIVAVGTGVRKSRLGERVWVWNAQWRRAWGTAAEFLAIAAEQAVPLPDRVSYAEGACLGIPATTAFHAVRSALCESGRTVLVNGGAGNVGRNAVEFASSLGCRVIALVSTEAKAAIAIAAGAAETINYRAEPVAERVADLTSGQGVASIIEVDLAKNAPLIERCLRPHGTLVVYGLDGNTATLNARWLLQNSITARFIFAYELSADDRSAAIVGIRAWLQDSRRVPAMIKVLPMDRVAEAHQLVESGGAIGNVVLNLAGVD